MGADSAGLNPVSPASSHSLEDEFLGLLAFEFRFGVLGQGHHINWFPYGALDMVCSRRVITLLGPGGVE